jgi:creatinine amidohydrolase
MTPLPRRRWQDMTSADFRALDAERTVAILPIGAIEQHGPHLPVFVDACINETLLDRVLERAAPGLAITALPMQAVGKSNEHLAFPGTLTLSVETLTRVCMELGESVERASIRKLVLLNSHGG